MEVRAATVQLIGRFTTEAQGCRYMVEAAIVLCLIAAIVYVMRLDTEMREITGTDQRMPEMPTAVVSATEKRSA